MAPLACWPLARLQANHSSIPFNPLIANTFFRAGLIESWGRGIEKINQACHLHGISKPRYKQDASGLMITFKTKVTKPSEETLKPSEETLKTSEKVAKPSEEILKTSEKGTKPSEEILKTSEKTGKSSEQIGKSSEKTSEKIMALLEQNPSLTAEEMATALGKTRRAIEMQINKLKNLDILQRIGPDKGGHWLVNRD